MRLLSVCQGICDYCWCKSPISMSPKNGHPWWMFLEIYLHHHYIYYNNAAIKHNNIATNTCPFLRSSIGKSTGEIAIQFYTCLIKCIYFMFVIFELVPDCLESDQKQNNVAVWPSLVEKISLWWWTWQRDSTP